MKCDECGNVEMCKNVSISGEQRTLCRSCLAVLHDKCIEELGFFCENCEETHFNYRWERVNGTEYMVCLICGCKTEVESYNPTQDDIDHLNKFSDILSNAKDALEK